MSLWLWCRLAPVAPIQPIAWEPLYAASAALKKQKKKKKNQLEQIPHQRSANANKHIEDAPHPVSPGKCK